jgi:hypothetical protein
MSSASDEDEPPDDGAAVKAEHWIEEFGTQGVVRAAFCPASSTCLTWLPRSLRA